MRAQDTTTYPITFFLRDSVDHETGEAGKTPEMWIWKPGDTSFSQATGVIAEIGQGMYSFAGTSADRDTLGECLLYAQEPGTDGWMGRLLVVSDDHFAEQFGEIKGDAFIKATHALDQTATVTQVATSVLTDDRAIKHAALIDGYFGDETSDKYTVRFLESGEAITSGISSPTITVTQWSDGTVLVDGEILTEITDGWHKYSESINRVPESEIALIDVSATYGGGTIAGQLMKVNYG
jgi:hypothetical protein